MNLDNLYQQLDANATLPPVEKWNPPFCGDMDLEIKADGSWHYMGSPFTRQKLVRLFASVLKKEADKYFLVTPVEKIGIRVADVPFVITSWQFIDTDVGQTLQLTTNTGDHVLVSRQNPLELRLSAAYSEHKCYVTVRNGLDAILHRNVYYQLIEHGNERQLDGKTHLVIESAGEVFSLGKME